MTHPLQDEPDPKVIAIVKRFGLVGLIVCALLASLGGLLRRPLDIHVSRVRAPDLRSETILQSRK
jgi:hypothetical protein